MKKSNKVFLAIIIIVVIAGAVLFSVRSGQNQVNSAKQNLTKIVNEANLNSSNLVCEYGFVASFLGEGAGTRYIKYFLLDATADFSKLSDALSSNGFSSASNTQTLTPGYGYSFAEKVGISEEKAHISLSISNSGDKVHTYDNCKNSIIAGSYEVPAGKILLEISYLPSK